MVKKGCRYLFSILSIILIYYVVSHIVNNQFILPKYGLIYDYFKNVNGKDIFINTFATVKKAIYSYLFSMTLALIIAIISSKPTIYLLINPYISILKTLPTISIILLAIIWLGTEKALYLIPLLVVFPILYEKFVYEIRNIDPHLREVSEVYKFSVVDKIKYLYFYPLLEGLILSLKQTFGLCFKIIVMAEVIAHANLGLGARIQNEKTNLEMPGVF
ncbi:MAG TPA: hypothetical protein VIK84_03250, partial [Haloplasmataceae bacterium]